VSTSLRVTGVKPNSNVTVYILCIFVFAGDMLLNDILSKMLFMVYFKIVVTV